MDLNDDNMVKIGLINLPPSMELEGPDDNIKLGGYFGEFFYLIFNLINVSHCYVRIPDNKFGSFDKDKKTWSGMMKFLVENKVQIGASLSQTRSRENYVQFSPILYSTSYRLLYRKVDVLEWSYGFYLEPFQATIWGYLLGISGLAILFAQYYYFKSAYNFIRDLFLHITLMWPIAVLTANISINVPSSRIIFLCYYFFTLLMFISYNSILTAMMTIVQYETPFHSLDDMIMETDYFPIIIEGRSIQEDFLTAEADPWKTGWLKILNNKPKSMVKNNEEGINVAYSSKAAFITSLEDVQTITKNCSFNFAAGEFGILTDSIAYSNNFSYIETFNRRIIRFGECGILLQLTYRYYIGEKLCSTTDTTNKPVGKHKIVGITLMYICGVLLSLIVVLIEILISKQIPKNYAE